MKSLSNKTKTISNNEHLSFNDLFEQLYPSLCQFAESYLTVTADAEDLVQDVFIKLWGAFNEFDSLLAIKSFLFKALRNNCLNHIRHEKIKKKYEEQHLQEVITDEFFFQQMVETESRRIIRQTIEDLPPQCQKILRLSMHGLKNHEIAEDMNISINSVKTQKKKAYNILRIKFNSALEMAIQIMYL